MIEVRRPLRRGRLTRFNRPSCVRGGACYWIAMAVLGVVVGAAAARCNPDPIRRVLVGKVWPGW